MSKALDKVLTVFAHRASDAPTHVEDIAAEMDISIPRARHYLRLLNEQNLVWADENDTYGLTAAGDEHIVKGGLDLF
ncbi:MAG: ArsR family transcriptional regulator [Gemmatimonadetes bacterium]|nr:ArsR family transcriptional regulator [Gemmatimonadota bacterium]MCY3678632.1 ArsR family transcriptional regulator [Gemmatimonadota bacterium]MYA41589.1 ArsR family transcriptional regulator [Gemmatimonadota bacterium]MYE95098.1 ArsR family transcriptional regulator [Gemmatimonadota bacterium]MYJ09781.1 ArsR family transcriptional regulator [Gemmatimonadota bacterium]